MGHAMRSHVQTEPTRQTAALPPSDTTAAPAPSAPAAVDMAQAVRFTPRLADTPEHPPEEEAAEMRASPIVQRLASANAGTRGPAIDEAPGAGGAAERDEPALVAGAAAQAREAAAEQAAIQVRLELLLRVLRQPDVERAIGDGPVEGLEVVAHQLVERRRFRAVPLVAAGAAEEGGAR